MLLVLLSIALTFQSEVKRSLKDGDMDMADTMVGMVGS